MPSYATVSFAQLHGNDLKWWPICSRWWCSMAKSGWRQVLLNTPSNGENPEGEFWLRRHPCQELDCVGLLLVPWLNQPMKWRPMKWNGILPSPSNVFVWDCDLTPTKWEWTHHQSIVWTWENYTQPHILIALFCFIKFVLRGYSDMKQFIQNLAGQHQSCPDQTKAGISTTMESASSSSSGTAVLVVRSQLPTTQTGQGSLPHLGARPGPYMALLAAPALSAPISGQLAPPPHQYWSS